MESITQSVFVPGGWRLFGLFAFNGEADEIHRCGGVHLLSSSQLAGVVGENAAFKSDLCDSSISDEKQLAVEWKLRALRYCLLSCCQEYLRETLHEDLGVSFLNVWCFFFSCYHHGGLVELSLNNQPLPLLNLLRRLVGRSPSLPFFPSLHLAFSPLQCSSHLLSYPKSEQGCSGFFLTNYLLMLVLYRSPLYHWMIVITTSSDL